MRRAPGLVLAAPHSGSGKTLVTLALLRAYARSGQRMTSAKVGPDYIDPKFHEAAAGGTCPNLDPWAMREPLLRALAQEQCADADLLLIEGVMGLYDGAADGTGSTADLAALLGLPVVLIIDAAKQAQSVAALVRGFRDHGPARVAGVILNRVGSGRHAAMLRESLDAIAMPVLGAVPRAPDLTLPARHLGLVQAGEHADLDAFLERAADLVSRSVDLDAVAGLAEPLAVSPDDARTLRLAPLGQRIAIARDEAFAFAYPHLLEGWREQGAELSFFSPLANEAPQPGADAIYLPGGYPELHAGQLSQNAGFLAGLDMAAKRRALVYGECGGYMVLGEALTNADGTVHRMAGLLPLETSFQAPRLHLGYRRLTPCADRPWTGELTAHEFHYAGTVRSGDAPALFEASDAQGTKRDPMGLVRDTVMGSFAHVIDRL
ncbi:cobyrinic acid a,c-diamide synthase [Breoghania corrubedonensis]|uniref:Hydrogenobyrinate a,c-diamide synthase n=1 Tax=Breoghania corrubedonensis TaxID=665038 RepID=A0A2T5VFS0_9HYPH|nr:cobyrinate a,c-diamide synthase [Breoghania corrubedonensis]PTW62607.1 cobyrinic acid a,c-diamide synthase [Breoghania corrubedonensis]